MEEKNNEKIQSLREMIYNAEKTLQGAKAMLLQLEGKKKVGRRKKSDGDSEDGTVIEGTFDGQIMIGTDGKQYPVPANYASKSKLVEGDMLKLTITPDGSFIYKQIGPIERKRLIGLVSQDSDGNYFVAAEGKAYKVLLASITYFKVEPGDEVTLVAPRDMDSDWAAIENVLQKTRERTATAPSPIPDLDIDEIISEKKKSSPKSEETPASTRGDLSSTRGGSKKEEKNSILDEWTPDIEELRKELENDNDSKEK